eukprot:scaffold251780_cov31-Tisochrysis_lutea.AAC.5
MTWRSRSYGWCAKGPAHAQEDVLDSSYVTDFLTSRPPCCLVRCTNGVPNRTHYGIVALCGMCVAP